MNLKWSTLFKSNKRLLHQIKYGQLKDKYNGDAALHVQPNMGTLLLPLNLISAPQVDVYSNLHQSVKLSTQSKTRPFMNVPQHAFPVHSTPGWGQPAKRTGF